MIGISCIRAHQLHVIEMAPMKRYTNITSMSRNMSRSGRVLTFISISGVTTWLFQLLKVDCGARCSFIQNSLIFVLVLNRLQKEGWNPFRKNLQLSTHDYTGTIMYYYQIPRSNFFDALFIGTVGF